jgi:glycosyltransferase involved in cell wall biosynthesis
MKILFILNSLAPGGAEKHTGDLINGLNSYKFSVGLAYLNHSEKILNHIDQAKIMFCEHLGRKSKFDIDVNIVSCIEEYPFLYGRVIKKLHSKKIHLITILHHTLPRPGIWEFIKSRIIYPILLNQCDALIFVSRNQRKYWIQKYGIKIKKSSVIYNGVDEIHFTDNIAVSEKKTMRHGIGFTENDFVVGICAILRPEKHHHDFVDAIKYVYSKGYPIKGLIIGDGILKKTIHDKIVKDGLSDIIKITGFIHDVKPLLGICDGMVLTSHLVETFSLAALEAMSMQKPMIMSNIGGANELVTHGVNGYLFPAGDVKTLSKYLISFYLNRQFLKIMGRNARNTVIQHYTKSRMIHNYERLFSTINS